MTHSPPTPVIYRLTHPHLMSMRNFVHYKWMQVTGQYKQITHQNASSCHRLSPSRAIATNGSASATSMGLPAARSVRILALIVFWEEPGLRGIVFFLRFRHGLHGLHQPCNVILERANANLLDGEIKQGDKGLELSGGKIKLHRRFPWGLASWRCKPRARR